MKPIWTVAAALALCAPAQAQSRNPLDALRLDDLVATRERPLFRATRRPPQAPPPAAPLPEAPVAPSAVAEPPPYELIGVAIGGRTRIALLRDKGTNQVLRLHPGEDAEGWRVTAIDPRELKLTRAGRTESLALTGRPDTETAADAVRAAPKEAPAAAVAARLPRPPRPDD